jgi:protein-tyrosine kinase
MSIVEKTLEKMRDRRPAPAQAVFGTVAPIEPQRSSQAGSPAQEAAPARRLVIDQNGLREAGLLPPLHQSRQIAEQYRQIKRPLIANAMQRGAGALPNSHVVMMASALPQEGKSFTSINLAFSMAREKDVNVLLVDGDMPKPHISRLFGAADAPGLLDVLEDDKTDVGSVILPTDVTGLSLLPAGKRRENATELLASERMRALIARLAERDPRRIVLLDTPPLLLTTESQALAAVAGQIVLVVRAGHTAQQTVLDALSYLEGRAVALVLNQNMNSVPTGYYYYGYGETGDAQESSG